MKHEHATAVLAAAKRAEMSPGDDVVGLIAGLPLLVTGGGWSDHIAALTASNAHLSSLSRNLRVLTRFLTLGNVPQALVYRDMLDTLDGDFRRHLVLAPADRPFRHLANGLAMQLCFWSRLPPDVL